MITLGHAVEVGLLMLAAYLGGCVLGYASRLALRRLFAPKQQTVVSAVAPLSVEVTQSAARRLARVSAEAPPQPALVIAASTSSVRRPPELPGPRGRPDNLKLIKGIGAKTESTLQDLGIYHFDQIAAWQPAHVAWLEGRIAIKGRIGREQWIEQATLLATAPRSSAA